LESDYYLMSASGLTIAEKILASHSIPERESVSPGEFVWARVDETNVTLEAFREMKKLGVSKVFDPTRVFYVDDHESPPPSIHVAEKVAEMRRYIKEYGIKNWFEYGRHGILHQLFPEKGYCAPGELVAQADSHSTTYGFLNVASCAINAELVYVLIKGQLWFKVPETIRFLLSGDLHELCVGKDIILKIASEYGTDCALYKSIEYQGSSIKNITLDSRWTMSNMGVELGAKFAIFEADEKVHSFLKGRINRTYNPVYADSDANYASTWQLDLDSLEPMVACPHDPNNSKPAKQVEKDEIRVDQCYIGSCTNGRMEDLRTAAKILEGNKVHKDVRLLVSPASMEIWRNALKEELFEVFTESEAMVCHPTCGPCSGLHMGIIAAGERCISTTNRNFKGRMGSPDSEVYLGNAATVAASAIAGKIVDPRRYW
jgi:3-isopropylmalate/(R)-2-methylmalate dehydratase large subunit